MLTVGYQFIGRDLPAKSVVLPVTDRRSLKTYTLVRGEAWEFPLMAQRSRLFAITKLLLKKIQPPLKYGSLKKSMYP